MVVSADELEKRFDIRPPPYHPPTAIVYELYRMLRDIYKDEFEFAMKLSESMIEEAIKPLLLCSVNKLHDVFLEKYPVYVAYNFATSALTLRKIELSEIIEFIEKIYETLENIAPPELRNPVEVVSDCQVLIAKRIKELGWRDFFKRVEERCYEEYRYLLLYFNATAYLLTACLLAKFGLEHNPETLRTLIDWLNTYTKELDRYTVSVDLSVTDEYYEVIREHAL
jgi:hypothetical protein